MENNARYYTPKKKEEKVLCVYNIILPTILCCHWIYIYSYTKIKPFDGTRTNIEEKKKKEENIVKRLSFYLSKKC